MRYYHQLPHQCIVIYHAQVLLYNTFHVLLRRKQVNHCYNCTEELHPVPPALKGYTQSLLQIFPWPQNVLHMVLLAPIGLEINK